MIYRIFQDQRYLIHQLSSAESLEKLPGDYGTFSFNCNPIAYQEHWVPLAVEFVPLESGTGTKGLPDISENHTRLYFNAAARDIFKQSLAPYGEFLPLENKKGQSGWIFNPLQVAETFDALERDKLGYDKHGNLVHWVFDETKISSIPIFKSEVDNYTGLYCTEVFKSAVESAGLTGLIFSRDYNIPEEVAYGTTH